MVFEGRSAKKFQFQTGPQWKKGCRPLRWKMIYFYVLWSKNILMKLVGYQQPTCLCVKMEFVVGIISLWSELYSISWSCFRSPGSCTIVYVKWCFDLHVECCGSCMVSTIAVESGKIFGVLKIFARMFSNLPEKFWATLPTNFFPQRSWRPFFGMTSG